LDGFLGKRVSALFGTGWMIPMTEEPEKRVSLAYDVGYNHALQDAINVVKDFEPYDPYIVGKIKIEIRKEQLIELMQDLMK